MTTMQHGLHVDADIEAILDALDNPDSVRDLSPVAALAALEAEDARRTVFGIMRAMQRERAALADRRAWLQMVSHEAQQAITRGEATLAFLEEQATRIAEQLVPEGKKSVDIPGLGRIQYRDTKTSVRIADPEAFVAWAKDHERPDLYEVVTTEKPLTNAAKAEALMALIEAGELLPGVDEIPATRTASIQWGHP